MHFFQILRNLIKTHFMSSIQKDLQILALRSQLSVLQQQLINNKITKPRFDDRFRKLWVFLSKALPDWKSALMLVKPETVLRWHRRAFRLFWRRKSKGGRPSISPATIALIKRIYKENAMLSPEKIHERLLALNIADAPAPNTIAKYIKEKRKPPTDNQRQSWKTFLRNHAKGISALDFAIVPTLSFKALYVLLIISHARRKIEHFAVTEHPTAERLIQQIRNATPFGNQPKYLIHDNGQPFHDKRFQLFLAGCGINSKSITPHSPWQNAICERLVGIVRRDLLDHIIPLSQKHLERLLAEYVYYYNHVRTHQALDGDTPVKTDALPRTLAKDTALEAKPILGGLYHEYRKAA